MKIRFRKNESTTKRKRVQTTKTNPKVGGSPIDGTSNNTNTNNNNNKTNTNNNKKKKRKSRMRENVACRLTNRWQLAIEGRITNSTIFSNRCSLPPQVLI